MALPDSSQNDWEVLLVKDAKVIIGTLNKRFEEFTGTKKYKVRKGIDKAELGKLVRMLRQIRKEQLTLIGPLALKEEMIRIFNQIEKVRKKKFQIHPVDGVVNILTKYFHPPSDNSSLINTKYFVYRQAVLDIAKKVQDKNKVAESLALFEDVSGDDMNNFGNQAERLAKKLPMLDKQYKNTNGQPIEKYVDLYYNMCAHMEKIVMLLVGVNKIINGESTSFSELKSKKPSFGNNLKELKKLPHFKELVEPIDSTIRNAIVHVTWTIAPSDQRVFFKDRDDPTKNSDYSFTDFMQKCREAAVAMILACHVDSAIILPEMERFGNFVKS